MYGDHIWILLTFSEFGCNCYVNATRMPVMPENAYELCGVAKLDVKIITCIILSLVLKILEAQKDFRLRVEGEGSPSR